MANYDYIFLGAGAAGLMLAREMAEDAWFSSYKILIIERDEKNRNDRTWCFWEKGDGKYDHLLTRRWDHIYFKADGMDKKFSIDPYNYKMLRSADFYREHLDIIGKAPHIEFLNADVEKIEIGPESVKVTADSKIFNGSYIFNSLFDYKELLNQRSYPVLQQHFVGWFVESDEAVFDSSAPIFMDFSIEQKGNTRFMYVLPFSENLALVEYTLFSSEMLEYKEYEEAIEQYLTDHFGLIEYRIKEKEKGNIPMTCFDFEAGNSERMVHIGTAGGWAKPSTGYTFKNSMKYSRAILSHIKKGSSFKEFSIKKRHWYYDLLLLDILSKHNEEGSRIFTSMFKNSSPQQIFQFLDEESSLFQDLRVILSCPFMPFTKALFNRVGHKVRNKN